MIADDVILGGSPKVVRFGGDVKSIFKSLGQGYHKDYDLLLHQLSDPNIKSATLACWLRELRGCTSKLTRELEHLVAVLLKLEWTTRDASVVAEYQDFLTSLVSAQTFYLKAVIRMLVKHFVPKIKPSSGDDVEDEVEKEMREEIEEKSFECTHTALKDIIKIAPLAPTVLMSLLSEYFPYMKKEIHTQECYVKNLLEITLYLPNLRSKIMELIVEKMIKIDVHAPKHEVQEAEMEDEDDDNEDENEFMEEDMQFDMEEIEDTDNSIDEIKKDNKEDIDDDEGGPMNHEMADKLDVMMSVLLPYIHHVCHPHGKFNMEHAKPLWRQLLGIFEKVILPTHASCHVQYIMFYMCSFNPSIVDAFLDFLLKKIQDPNTIAIVRQSAAAYVSSFLSRAKFVPLSIVKATFDILLPWIHKYIDGQDGSTRSYPDVDIHGPFYSVCQAVFYTFVFRHKEFLESSKNTAYVKTLNFSRIVMCRLNPLRVCLPTVVNMFATVTRMYQIVYCYTVMERNNRSFLPVVSHGQNKFKLTNLNPLDSFFPFDPYLLSRSKKYVKPFYQEWEGNLSDQEDVHSSANDEDELTSYSVSNPDSYLPLGVTPTGAHVISPGFKHTELLMHQHLS
ncbi:RNA polymerase I-specific transcription initiation factor RRN3-like isoform X2 [Glandiceps talaboti]